MEEFEADFVLDGATAGLMEEAVAFREAFVDAVVELVARELDLAAQVVVLDEADEVAGGEARVVEEFDDALGGEVAGLFLEARGFGGIGRGVGLGGGKLLAAPLEHVGAVHAPDGGAGGGDAVALAEFGALFPAVAGAGRRVVEQEEEFVEERDGLPGFVLGALDLVQQRVEARGFGEGEDPRHFRGGRG